MPGVPRQLRLVLARPTELRPAIRQRPQEQPQLRPTRPDRNPLLKPVVLRLHPRRRLHPTDRPHPRRPVLLPHMTHHRLITAPIPVIPNQRLVNQANLARPTLPKKPPVSQTLLDRLHHLPIPVQRRRLTRSTIQSLSRPQALQPIPNRSLRHPQILRQTHYRRPPLTHPARHPNLVHRQLHAPVLRRTNGALRLPVLLPWRPSQCAKVGVSQPPLYGRLLQLVRFAIRLAKPGTRQLGRSRSYRQGNRLDRRPPITWRRRVEVCCGQFLSVFLPMNTENARQRPAKRTPRSTSGALKGYARSPSASAESLETEIFVAPVLIPEIPAGSHGRPLRTSWTWSGSVRRQRRQGTKKEPRGRLAPGFGLVSANQFSRRASES